MRLTVPMVLLVKLKSEGKVRIMVSVLLFAPVGDVKVIVCEDTALIVADDMASEAEVMAAACAVGTGSASTKKANVKVRLVSLWRFFKSKFI